MKSTTTITTDPIIASAKCHFIAAGDALRKGCAEALITGMHLIALHARSNAGHGGDRRSLSAKDGFNAALIEIGIADTTARRWMSACRNAALRLTLLMDGDDITEQLPDHGTPLWQKWENEMRKLADGMSLSRLLLGQVRDSTEDHRYEALLSGEEDGSSHAADLLSGVAEGRYTLAQAVKALGSREAYDQLRKQGGDKIRRDPVYLDLHFDTKKPIGLIPKAIVTLHNGFEHWDDYDPDAREQVRAMWKQVITKAPSELTKIIREQLQKK